MTTFARTFLRTGASALLATAVLAATCGTGARAQDKKKHAEETPAVPSYYGPQPAVEDIDLTMYARIRAEGFTHGKVMQFAEALSRWDRAAADWVAEYGQGQCVDAR